MIIEGLDPPPAVVIHHEDGSTEYVRQPAPIRVAEWSNTEVFQKNGDLDHEGFAVDGTTITITAVNGTWVYQINDNEDTYVLADVVSHP